MHSQHSRQQKKTQAHFKPNKYQKRNNQLVSNQKTKQSKLQQLNFNPNEERKKNEQIILQLTVKVKSKCVVTGGPWRDTQQNFELYNSKTKMQIKLPTNGFVSSTGTTTDRSNTQNTTDTPKPSNRAHVSGKRESLASIYFDPSETWWHERYMLSLSHVIESPPTGTERLEQLLLLPTLARLQNIYSQMQQEQTVMKHYRTTTM